MAYDQQLAERIRGILNRRRGITEKQMFGGLAFLVNGKMCCGIVGHELMVRVGPAGYEKALFRRHVRPMDFTGKPLKGFVYVARPGFKSDRNLRMWVDQAIAFARKLPAK